MQLIRNDGVEALERLSNDIELIILLRYVLEMLTLKVLVTTIDALEHF